MVPALTILPDPAGGPPVPKLRSNLWSTSTLEAGLKAIDGQRCKVEQDERVQAWAAELKAWGGGHKHSRLWKVISLHRNNKYLKLFGNLIVSKLVCAHSGT